MAEAVVDKATGLAATANKVEVDNREGIAAWCGGAALLRTDDPATYPEGRPVVEFFTGQGVKTADVGQWVVGTESIYGTIFVVLSEDDYHSRYEPVPIAQEG